MEAAASSNPRTLSGDKAQRIVEAMRRSVARRGVAGSTFDHVAREAGVSRGLLHYYFGTKERLLTEVVRRDGELKMEALEAQLGEAQTADDFIDLLVASLQDLVEHDPDLVAVGFELFTLSQRNPEIAAEYAELQRGMCQHVATVLAAKQEEGVLHLAAPPAAVVEVLLSLADGLALRMLLDPQRDHRETIAAGVAAVRALVADPA
ncbi:TetR/AcrR family transcriptional regulator [Capillimicrobium parvum]|uniref:HTH-type transcriptional regulator BetI n=1 Tax=Capillimicrobium parvum TaxID=2884022 RepID=A0A9E6XUG5_9ACTN|nr:TetR/AcrR family transcriptional regulator [Capillimicrobium parvum]UGS34594.1 HTH-type transcriptional regulator BetI [Capillimicrobium parvum]